MGVKSPDDESVIDSIAAAAAPAPPRPPPSYEARPWMATAPMCCRYEGACQAPPIPRNTV
jgi:hypothetical protein